MAPKQEQTGKNSSSTLIRILDEDKEYLQQLARQTKQSMSQTVHHLVQADSMARMMERYEASYATIYANARTRRKAGAEFAAWDAASEDGLDVL